MLSVDQKSIGLYKRSLENTVVCHFDMLENAHFWAHNSPSCIWLPGSARTRAYIEPGKEFKMGYVSRIVKLHNWQPYRLAF